MKIYKYIILEQIYTLILNDLNEYYVEKKWGIVWK